MLAAELIFYKHEKIIRRIDDEDYDHFNDEELKIFVANLVNETGATRVVENRIYHHQHSGILTTLFPLKEADAIAG
jgi:hypothetical protein